MIISHSLATPRPSPIDAVLTMQYLSTPPGICRSSLCNVRRQEPPGWPCVHRPVAPDHRRSHANASSRTSLPSTANHSSAGRTGSARRADRRRCPRALSRPATSMTVCAASRKWSVYIQCVDGVHSAVAGQSLAARANAATKLQRFDSGSALNFGWPPVSPRAS